MAGPEPHAIWNSGIEEGKRRLDRGSAALVATGIVGGFDVLVGILVYCVGIASLGHAMPEETARFIASLFFGIAFVHIVLGRSELFTENFLVPVSAVLERKSGTRSLLRLSVLSLLGISSRWRFWRGSSPARESCAASETDVARILVAMLIGFALVAPSLNHAVVGFGEMTFALASDETHATWGQMGYHFAIAVGGNLIGGLLFVASARLVQARGEPDSEAEPGGKAERDH